MYSWEATRQTLRYCGTTIIPKVSNTTHTRVAKGDCLVFQLDDPSAISTAIILIFPRWLDDGSLLVDIYWYLLYAAFWALLFAFAFQWWRRWWFRIKDCWWWWLVTIGDKETCKVYFMRLGKTHSTSSLCLYWRSYFKSIIFGNLRARSSFDFYVYISAHIGDFWRYIFEVICLRSYIEHVWYLQAYVV